MDDLIQRQAVDTLVDELARAISDERSCMSRGRSTATIMQNILDLPSVKPQEKTGHWLMTGEIDVYYDLPSYECSKCGQTSLEEGDYCPNCGARMFEPQESEDEE